MSKWIDADAAYELLEPFTDAFTDVEVTSAYVQTLTLLANAPSIDIEPKRGEWEEKETFHNADDNPIIEEWQSARCSVCGKYHTTPYMYYFNDYNFCPNCGARMKGKDNE